LRAPEGNNKAGIGHVGPVSGDVVGSRGASAPEAGRAAPATADRSNIQHRVKRTRLFDLFCIPAFFRPGNFAERASARFLSGPKVSFASLRWGTEPEGWYVDLPYAVF